MMKVKITNKDLRQGYYTISLGYCDAQDILKFQAARFYNYGLYGWNYDVYEIDWNIAICTGYRPIKSVPEKINQEAAAIIRKYNKKAAGLNSWDYKSYANYRRSIERLYNRMVNELKEVVNYSTVNGKK